MASPDLQAKANTLNAKLEGEARIVIDDIERNLLRPVARNAYACVVKCYDSAGKNGSAETLDNCSRQCQNPYQMANNVVQQEIGQFQNRLNRSMTQCNDDASAMITPDVQRDARKMKKVEDAVLSCISKTVDNQLKQLGPMKQRVASQLKQLSK
mmetsp:Transcript_19674/g.24815  ORF Transcript_19674/g.24815 Transcript_19674/m.24815 type:complete len:154 (+) Transcript_19674:58-519(+)|eukprot:CAMPEP_0203663358 /NCGR_PEP_ID=MMETSP0090-20130426/963_1 /ASSEMBLY_ACC=CAM_ASM_001088 /TAXON_ID=426623 /ORGANISM="Chaetoceros affinis, Strain CCMP159" /LENGTH=153 /DNA_ID=CAMNT_0050526245 /DNA_START=58 /DNA_END=519 /DNA_ORIENTATION=-